MPHERGHNASPRRRPGLRFDLFISYASADRQMVEPFVRQLEDDDFAIFFDQSDVVEFRPLPLQLADAMDASALIVMCVTPAYMKGRWTTYEAQNAVAADPGGLTSRIVPVWLDKTGIELPNYLRHLPFSDLSEHDPFGARYRTFVGRLRRALAATSKAPGRDEIARLWRDAVTHRDDHDLTVFLVRRAALAVVTLVYREAFGQPDAVGTLDDLCDDLLRSGKLPSEASGPLGALRTLLGRVAVRDEAQCSAEETRETAARSVEELERLGDWVFPELAERRGTEHLWDSLPAAGDDGRLLPGTPYVLHGPPRWQTSRGPVFAGRDVRSSTAVAVVLAAPGDRVPAGPAQLRAFAAPNLVLPQDAGTVTVDGVTHGSYLVLPELPGENAVTLVERVGPLPPRAACEVGTALAAALVALHEESPPLAHGAVAPTDVVIAPDGSVRLLTLGPEPGGQPQHDIAGLRSTVSYLITGSAATAPAPSEVLTRLDRAAHAREALRVLRKAGEGATDGGLTTVVPGGYASAGLPPDVVLADVSPIEARAAWPLGPDEIVSWNDRTERLQAMRGDELRWEDSERIQIRRVDAGRNARLGVGGWEGAVRYFTGESPPVAALRIDGAVGDLRCVRGALIAGSWKSALWRIPDTGGPHEILPVQGGVHRIAVIPRGDRFAVAALSGRIDFYLATGDRHGASHPAAGLLTDIAYAGTRLVLVTHSGVAGLRVDGSRGEPVPLTGAFAVWAAGDPGQCLLLTRSDAGGPAPTIRLIQVDEADRHLPYLTLPPGDRLVSADAAGRRLVTVRKAGCAYWRDGKQVVFWPDARNAALSADGRRIAVCRARRVELYADQA